MIAFIHAHNDNRCLFLVFDSGEHAVHHGMLIWTIFDPSGQAIDTFDAYSDGANTPARKQVIDYTNKHKNTNNTLGRIDYHAHPSG